MWGTLKLQNLDINGPDNGGPIVTKFPRWSRLLCVCRRSRLLLLHVSAAQLRRLAVRQACSWTPPQLKYVKSYIWLPKGSAHIMDVYLLTVDSLTKKTAPSWEFSYNQSLIIRPINVQSFVVQFINMALLFRPSMSTPAISVNPSGGSMSRRLRSNEISRHKRHWPTTLNSSSVNCCRVNTIIYYARLGLL